MKKRFEELRETLDWIQNQITSLYGSSGSVTSTIPALSPIFFLLDGILRQQGSDMIEQLCKDLEDLHQYNGPQAKLLKQMKRLGVTCYDGRDADTIIRSSYPTMMEEGDRFELNSLLDGIFPNLHWEGYKNSQGRLRLDLAEEDPKLVELFFSPGQWVAQSPVVRTFALGKGEVKASLTPCHPTRGEAAPLDHLHEVPLEVKIEYPNGAVVTTNLTLSGRRTIRHHEEGLYCPVYVYQPQPLGWSQVPDLSTWRNSASGTPNFFSLVVYNEFEQLTYPGSNAFMSQSLVKNLLWHFFEKAGCRLTDSTDHFWLDEKILYQRLTQFLSTTGTASRTSSPLREEAVLNSWHGMPYGFASREVCKWLEVRTIVNDPTEGSWHAPVKEDAPTIGRMVSTGLVIDNAENYMVRFVLDDRTESAKLYLSRKGIEKPFSGKMTARTVETIFNRLVKYHGPKEPQSPSSEAAES